MGGAERAEDLAAAVVRGRAGAGETEAGAAGDPLALRVRERRVGRDDHDAAPFGRLVPDGSPSTGAGDRWARRRPRAARRRRSW